MPTRFRRRKSGKSQRTKRQSEPHCDPISCYPLGYWILIFLCPFGVLAFEILTRARERTVSLATWSLRLAGRPARLGDGEQPFEFGPELDDFAEVGGGEFSNQGFSALGEPHLDPASVGRRGAALDQFAVGEPIDDANGAVMLQVQVICQLGDRDELSAREPFDREQSLMLLGRKAGCPRRILAKLEKTAQRVPPRRESLVVLLGQRDVAGHGGAKKTRRGNGDNVIEIHRSTI
jgi:hypothetical protein